MTNEKDFIEKIILLLSYYDNIHDFGILCTKENKYVCEELLKNYKKMLTKEIIIINKTIDTYFVGNDELIKYYKNNIVEPLYSTVFSSFDKNKYVFINLIKYIIDKKINIITKIDFDNMQNIVLMNFKVIFNGIININDLLIILNYSVNTNIDIDNDTYDFIEFNEFINKKENNIEVFYNFKYVHKMIFLQRQQLYYLIKYYNESNLKFNSILDYFLEKTTDYDNYKMIIIKNLSNNTIKQNVTFPVTMFDDMSTDTLNSNYINGLFKFKIINSDKEYIDSALTFNGLDFKGQLGSRQVMFIQDKTKKIKQVSFHVDNLEINIKEYKFIFDKEKKYIKCTYIDDITFYVKYNSVGRNYKRHSDESAEGIFQIIILIINILKKNIDYKKELIIDKIDYNKINEYIVVDDIFYESIMRINKYDNPYEILVTLLFGVKRFGDWCQMNVSKKYYLYLQTDDLLCKLYGILIGAPVLWMDDNYNIIAYNYDKINTNEINVNYDKKNINIIHRKLYENIGNKFGNIKKPVDIQHKITPFEKIYYVKYLKYKMKYIKLKYSI